MAQLVNVQEAKATLSRLLVEVESGNEVIIARSGQPVARLVPVERTKKRELGFIPGVVSNEAMKPLSDEEIALWY